VLQFTVILVTVMTWLELCTS